MTPDEAVLKAKEKMKSSPLDDFDVMNLVHSVYEEGRNDGKSAAFQEIRMICDRRL